MKKHLKHRGGFTLIEVLLVVAIIAILAGIVIIAINPAKQLADSRNAQREADVKTIIDAVYQYSIDNNGNIPSTITTTPTDVCATGAASCTGLIDLSVVVPKYVVKIPADPSSGTSTDTHYQISKDANNRLLVSAPDAEQGKSISVNR